MAAATDPSPVPEASTLSIGSYETALCIVPPRQLWAPVDRLRALYDKAYEKWPPHVNLVYPFVRPESLDRAADLVRTGVQDWRRHYGGLLRVGLDAADVFAHNKHDSGTIYIHDSDEGRSQALAALRTAVLAALGHRVIGNDSYQAHMTVGQSQDLDGSMHRFLLHKASLLPDTEWPADRLCVLVRERTQPVAASAPTIQMKIWGTVSLVDGSVSRINRPEALYEMCGPRSSHDVSGDDEATTEAEMDELQSSRPPYSFDHEAGVWKQCTATAQTQLGPLPAAPSELAVASYNVLAEFEWPPSQARYPLLVANMLSSRAAADVMVLQEVTDDFLSYLLRDDGVRAAYPFVSHGPPEQPEIEPLPSLLNIVVLSKWPFGWEWVSFKRQHKGSVVVKFRDIGRWDDGDFVPLVLATVHLTCGLTNGSVSNKKIELQRIVNYLKREYPDHAWILAGDFNIPTSSLTIETALEKKAISALTANYIAGLDQLLDLAGLVDAWRFSRHELGDASDGESSSGRGSGPGGNGGDETRCCAGEEGATYDPRTNSLAAKIVGSGFNNQPQRYDRILVRGAELVSIAGFNEFGFLTSPGVGGDNNSNHGKTEPVFASDHWGVRCILRMVGESDERQHPERPADEIRKLVVPVHLKGARPSLGDAGALREVLAELGVFPSRDEAERRERAFGLLKSVLVEPAPGEAGEATALGRLASSLVVVPVGSYGLGVWTARSDLDCLCVGPLSSQTFFALAVQRLRKATARGVAVRILRRVRAASGIMLELDVQGIRADLQYCPAAAVAEAWPGVLRLPASDPVFSLPAQTLAKLKAARDLDYLRRSLPDPDGFRVAHRFVTTWARSRGIYAARFGYLGGFHVSLLLARVCKLLTHDGAPGVPLPSVPDILSTFFGHYAAFDWQHQVAFDPFFHSRRLQYTRSPAREPLAILGYFPPALNVAQAGSPPSVRTLADEFGRADRLISEDGMTWSRFLDGDGAAGFLTAYRSYVRIDVQYWGLSPARGAAFVGWLESRCVMLLVDMSRRLPRMHARMWPARFVEVEDSASDATPAAAPAVDEGGETAGRDYRGCYLVGIDVLQDANNSSMSRDEIKMALGALQTVLSRFEDLIRGDERYFDATSEWMSATVTRRSELGRLTVDARDWGAEYGPGDEEDDDDDGEEEEEEEEEDEVHLSHGEGRSKKNKRNSKKQSGPVVPMLGPGKKFRSAADVIARLRWDSSFDSADYIVGYLDRFVGARERPLDMWKSELTDEEFIPQHRVLYFKRKADGLVVWERKTRKDEIFGSGV